MEPIKTYACSLKDDDIRMSSSSGAVFSALASYVFSKKGVLYGVTMSEDCYFAEFISVTDEKGLIKLRGSKYLQAKVGNTYKRVRSDLLDGRFVLFTGTGCQISGLKYYLGKDYDNLICVDVICHGAPSPALWKKYVLHQEEKNSGKLKYVNFRCKDQSWTDFGMKEAMATIPENQISQSFISKNTDPYMQMFLRDYCLRPSCYECPAKIVKMSDISIADFWGIQKVAPEFNDEKGTSLVLIRTMKGKDVFDKVLEQFGYREVSYEDGVSGNKAEYQSAKRPSQRDSFFLDMERLTFEDLSKIYAAPIKVSVKTKIKRQIKKVVMPVLRIIRGVEQNKFGNYGLLFVFEKYEDK